MQSEFTLEQYDEAVAFIHSRTRHQPAIGLVLGSGLGPLAEQIEQADIIPYAEIPHFPVSTVASHAGRLVIGVLSGVCVCAMQGRFHFYEGYSMAQVTLPIRALWDLRGLTISMRSSGGNGRTQIRLFLACQTHRYHCLILSTP